MRTSSCYGDPSAWLLGAVLALAGQGCHAQASQPPRPAAAAGRASDAPVVYTRARLVSFQKEAATGKAYVRLKLLPRSKIPFTVQTFRVLDPGMLQGIAPGSWVQFTAQHIAGENTLTGIRATAECRRFEPCD